MHCYIVIVYNLHTTTFKRLLHVSILRSSSGSTYCSLLKLHVKTINTLLYVPVMQQHIGVCVYVVYLAGREGGREGGRRSKMHGATIKANIPFLNNDSVYVCIPEFLKS